MDTSSRTIWFCRICVMFGVHHIWVIAKLLDNLSECFWSGNEVWPRLDHSIVSLACHVERATYITLRGLLISHRWGYLYHIEGATYITSRGLLIPHRGGYLHYIEGATYITLRATFITSRGLLISHRRGYIYHIDGATYIHRRGYLYHIEGAAYITSKGAT
jgi:hypothetical protein